jgi:hypothetical protein
MNVPVYGENYRKINADLQMLKVFAQSAPNMTVNVNPGSYWINGNTFYEFAGGTTTAVVNPTVGAYWVAVILVGSAIQLVYGQSSADTPVFPTLPSKSVPLAALYIKASDTVITSDMIFDIRPIFAAGGYPEKHNDLANRDAVDCHPIEAISGLKDTLAGKVSTEAMAQAIRKCAAYDGTKSKVFTLNAAETGSPSSDVYINVARGNQPNAAIRYNETDNRWEFTDDGQSFKPFDSTIDIDPFNQDNYYVKADIDSKMVNVEKEIATKAEASVVANLSTTVANAATVDYVNNQFQNLYGKQAMDDIVAEIRKDVATMSAKANVSDVYTKTESDAALVLKANAADVYAKAAVDEAVNSRALASDVYKKSEIDDALKLKANVENVYDKDTTDKLLADKTSAPDVYKYVDAQLTANMAKKQDALAFVPESIDHKNVVNGYAGLDANGKILVDQLPDSAKQGTYIVDDETARKALTGLVSGDRAYETNTGDSYIFDGKEWKLVADADWANVKLDFANIDNKPVTLAGYGITDAAVKTEVDTALALKANAADVYAKADVDTAVKAKANAADVYTKTEVDTAFEKKANTGDSYMKAETDTALALKANSADVYAKTDADKLFAAKANSADVYTKTESDAALVLKANAADVYAKTDADAKFALADDVKKMYTNDTIDNNISLKANAADVYTKKEVDASLALKANVTDVYAKKDVDGELAKKANVSEVFTQSEITTKLADKVNTTDFTTFQDTVATTYATSAAVADKYALKTDVASTSGYTQAQADARFALSSDVSGKANSADVYTKTQSDAKYALATDVTNKANAADVYTKAEVDTAVNAKANTADVNSALDKKANTSTVYTKEESDAAYETQTAAKTALDLKANVADVYKKTEVDSALALKANVADVYTKAEVDTAVGAKAVKADVDSAIALKANTADVYAKADKLPGADIVLTSQDGTKFSISVSNDGVLTATKIA